MKNYPQRKSMRLSEYNYNSVGYYYITINTYEKVHHFGDSTDGNLRLNKYGGIALKHWLQIPTRYNNCKLDEFIIMPNHIHGIIFINEFVGNRLACSAKEKRQYQSIPKIVGGFKAGVTRELNKKEIGISFRWQKSYHDHIIRNDYSLNLIREYIRNNPKRIKV